MNQHSTLRKSRWLLLTLLALLTGTGQAVADTIKEEFTTADWPAGWELGGKATASDYYIEYDSSNDYSYPTGRQGVYGGVASGTEKYIITPTVTGAGTFKFKRRNSSNGSVYVYTIEANGTLSASPIASNTSKPTSFTAVSFNIGSENKRLAIVLNGRIDDFTYTEGTAAVIPFSVYSDAAATTKVGSGLAVEFGLTETAQSQTYYVKNESGAALSDLAVSHTGNAVLSTVPSTLAAGSVAQLTITQAAAGTTQDVVTISSGETTFTINVSGTMKDANKLNFDFTTAANAWPDKWTAEDGWTYDETNQYSTADAEASVVSGRVKVATGGEQIFISHYGTVYDGGSMEYSYVKVYTSTDMNSWTEAGAVAATHNTWVTTAFDIPASAKYIKITAREVNINSFYGLEDDSSASFATMSFVADDYDFGLISETKTTEAYTITNTGNAELTGLSISVAGSSAFTVSSVADNIAAGESVTFTVSMAAGTPGVHTATINISSTNGGEASFKVSGVVSKDGMSLIDFEDNQLPARWAQGSTAWTFEGGAAKGVMLYSVYATMTTPKVAFADGDFLVIKAKKLYENSDGSLLIEGSTDGTDFTAFSKELTADADWQMLAVTNIPTSVKYLRFTGKYVLVDEIRGITYAPELVVTDKDGAVLSSPATFDFGYCSKTETVTYSIANAAGNGGISITGVSITGEGAASYTTNWTASVAVPFDLTISRAYDADKADKAQAAAITVSTTEGSFVINVTGTDMSANNPVVALSMGTDVIDAAGTIDFDMATLNTAKTLTLANSGTGTMTVNSITVPAGYTLKDGAAEAIFPMAITATTPKELTLAISTLGLHRGTMTIKVDGIATDFTATVNGFAYSADDLVLDFSSSEQLNRWTNSPAWTVGDGVAKSVTTGQNSLLTSPKLIVKQGRQVALKAIKGGGVADELSIHYSTDNGATWSTKTNYADQLSTEAFTLIAIDGIAASADQQEVKLEISGWNVLIDNLTGFSYNANDPLLAVYTDAATTVAAGEAATADLGFNSTDASSTYYIKNTGTGTLTISNIDVTAGSGFTATTEGGASSVTTGVLPLTVTLPATAGEGLHEATVTVTTDAGTFTVSAKGFVTKEGKFLADFTATDATFPAGWTTTDWTITGGAATTSAATALETKGLKAAAGEKLYVDIKGSTASGTKTFSYSYSADNGATWSDAVTLISESGYTSVADQIVTISNIADATDERTVLIRFVGTGLGIRHIYGFEAVVEPIMTTTAEATHDFGTLTAASDIYEVVVKNEGTAQLTGFSATLAAGAESAYEIVNATELPATIAIGGQAIVKVRQKAGTTFAEVSDVLTLKGDGQTDITIALTGKTIAEGKYYVASVTTSTLTTALQIEAGEKVRFDVDARNGASLTISYTTDGGVTTQEMSYTLTYGPNKNLELSLDNTETVTAWVTFRKSFADLLNVYGGKETTAPRITVQDENGTALVNNAETDFGNVSQTQGDQTVVYTIGNEGTAPLVTTVTATGNVSAAIATAETEGVTIDAANNKVTLEPAKTATITVTLPFAAPYGEQSGHIIISSEGAVGDIMQSYKAVLVDPAAMYVDFADNQKPAGWYSDGFTFTGGSAQAGYTASQLITEQFEATSDKGVLSFDAWYTSSSDYVTKSLTVYTSTDRKTWSEGKTFSLTTESKTCTLDELPAGKYYVKFEGAYVAVDNLTGLNTIATAPVHDIYVASSDIPSADIVPATDITAKVKVAALRADEEVTATLYFGTAEIASQTITIGNGTASEITLTGSVPAEENTYSAYIKVEASGLTETTTETAVKVAHVRTLAIESFSRTKADDEADVLTADADNKFSATFSVVVKNTGSTALTPTVSIKRGETVVGTATAETAVAPEETATLSISATGMSAGEGGEQTFSAVAAYSTAADAETFAFSTPVTISVVASAPLFQLAQGTTAIDNNGTLAFGIVNQATTKTLTITNAGTRQLELISITAPEGYTATALTSANKTIAPAASLDIDLTLKAEQGKKGGNLVFTYKVDETTNSTFTLAVSGRSVSTDTWFVDFEDGTIPTTWRNDNGWTVAETDGNHYATLTGWDAKSIVTPRLKAEANEELSFEVLSVGNAFSYAYSSDNTMWSEEISVSTTGEHTFKAPEAGNYYLRFTTRNGRLDNLVGFAESPLEHEIAITQSTIPTSLNQYAWPEFSVTVKEFAGKQEDIKATLYLNAVAISLLASEQKNAEGMVEPNQTKTLTFRYQPSNMFIGMTIGAYIEVSYADGLTVKTETVDVTINEAPVIDEENQVDEELATFSDKAVMWKHTWKEGWNTMCVPFDFENTDYAFGDRKYYKFVGYENNQLKFETVTSLEAGTPYLYYSQSDGNRNTIIQDVTVNFGTATPSKVSSNGVAFQGTYAKKDAGQLTDNFGVANTAKGAQIVRLGSEAYMKGFRAYFTGIPVDAAAPRLVIDGQTTGIMAVQRDGQWTIDDTAFDMSGRHTQNKQKGSIYIVNGKKVVVK
ncbi:MAG: choice-of-anchor D domain-containing protein [Prevotella sp.]|nr:choice-of-anchor D domain-containing protein [Prevotella sp.]